MSFGVGFCVASRRFCGLVFAWRVGVLRWFRVGGGIVCFFRSMRTFTCEPRHISSVEGGGILRAIAFSIFSIHESRRSCCGLLQVWDKCHSSLSLPASLGAISPAAHSMRTSPESEFSDFCSPGDQRAISPLSRSLDSPLYH